MSLVLTTLLSSGAINQVYGSIALSLYIIFAIPLLRRRRAQLNAMVSPAFWVLFFFGITYVVIGNFTLRGIEFYLFTPVLAYTAGWCIVENNQKRERTIALYIAFIVIGYGVHSLLKYSINAEQVVRWELTDFFSGQVRAATGSGCVNTIILSLFAYLVYIEKNKIIKVTGFILFIISVLYALLLGTRTQFIIFVAVNLVIFTASKVEIHGLKGIFHLAIIFALVFTICSLLYQNNVFEIKTYIETSNLMQRDIDSYEQRKADQYRLTSVLRGFLTMFAYPFGGLEDEPYYHNMWLDIGRIGGLIPFIIMVSYSVVTFSHVVRIFLDRTKERRIRYLLMSVYLGVTINFFVEPILEGLLDFFLIFCFMNGMVEYYYRKQYIGVSVRYENRSD